MKKNLQISRNYKLFKRSPKQTPLFIYKLVEIISYSNIATFRIVRNDLQISRNYKLFKQKNISSHKKIYKLVEIISYSNRISRIICHFIYKLVEIISYSNLHGTFIDSPYLQISRNYKLFKPHSTMCLKCTSTN